MTDRYAVFGNPVAHSRSPAIHAEFAQATGEDIVYERILAPLDGFAAAVQAFRASGGRGANVTLPFKREAWQLVSQAGGQQSGQPSGQPSSQPSGQLIGKLSARAEAAEAVNTLSFEPDGLSGDNTDGVGLVRDIEIHLGQPLAGARVLMIGAGGAAAGVMLPLIDSGVRRLHLANRTAARALAMAQRFAVKGAGDPGSADRVCASGLDAIEGEFDIVINATSASLGAAAPTIGHARFAPAALAYDMMYSAEPSAFLCAARARGARIADGIGMLIEQAAESFLIWRGVRPQTAAMVGRHAQPWRGSAA